MSLEKRTKIAFDDSRTLMLGAQILLGFQLQGPFQDGFASLPMLTRWLHGSVIILMGLVIALLIAPSARHRIVDKGRASEEINEFIAKIAMASLLPFAIALGLDMFIAGEPIMGRFPAGVIAAGLGAIALAIWLVPTFWRRRSFEDHGMTEDTSKEAKTEYVLTESRVVLPGAQALLGFQLAITMTSAFTALQAADKFLHLAALGFIALSTVLLLAPATYHRIVYHGRSERGFYRIASHLILAATVCIAAGLALDTFVVIKKATGEDRAAAAAALVVGVTLTGFWHIWPLWARYCAR